MAASYAEQIKVFTKQMDREQLERLSVYLFLLLREILILESAPPTPTDPAKESSTVEPPQH